jgi:hypothetical protein
VNARERLTSMVRTDRGSTTVWSPAEVSDALDNYRTEVLRKAIGRIRAIPVQCTALTGPVWYGEGWNDAITQLEEIADYQKPDDQDYHGELELLRAFALNVRSAARRGDLAFVQQLVEQHRQADKKARAEHKQ